MSKLGKCCDRMSGAIRMKVFEIAEKEFGIGSFWGIKEDIFIQTGARVLSEDLSYRTPPFFYCPFCGNLLVTRIE